LYIKKLNLINKIYVKAGLINGREKEKTLWGFHMYNGISSISRVNKNQIEKATPCYGSNSRTFTGLFTAFVKPCVEKK